jgi:Ca-activated chloride channel homolog
MDVPLLADSKQIGERSGMGKHLFRFSRIPLFLFWICAAGSMVLEAQEPQDPNAAQEISKIKADVSLVTMDVGVIPATSREFSAEDFIIRDNGVVQQVTHFSHDAIPLSIALVVDRSSSIKYYLHLLQQAALSTLGNLKPEDQIALFSFDYELLKLKDFTVDRNLIARIEGSIEQRSVGGATDIYRALYHTARYLKMKAPHSRRAIILVSDNCHTISRGIDKEDANIEVLQSGATLYSIQTPGKNPVCNGSIALVKQLAEDTGGESLNVDAPTSLQEALEKAISNMRHQYTLGFSPSDPGEEGSFHKLTLKLASEDGCRGCRLQARKGYYFGTSGSLSAPKNNRSVPGTPLTQVFPDSGQRPRHCIVRAAMVDLDLPDIPISVKASEQNDSDGGSRTKMDLHFDLSRVGFQTVGESHRFRLLVAIFSQERGTKEYSWGKEWRGLEGVLNEETYDQVLREGIKYSIAIPRRPRDQILKVVAYDEGTNTVGSRTVSAP